VGEEGRLYKRGEKEEHALVVRACLWRADRQCVCVCARRRFSFEGAHRLLQKAQMLEMGLFGGGGGAT
jgi:hypothetical protein